MFDGRASARSIHFIAMSLIVAFVVLHLVMVVLAAPFNEIRSMITGRFRLPGDKQSSRQPVICPEPRGHCHDLTTHLAYPR